MLPKNPHRRFLPIALSALTGMFCLSVASAATFLVDFGMASTMDPATQGAPTLGADHKGHFWNNVVSTAYANTVTGTGSLSLANLVTMENTSSTLSLQLAGPWKSSGIANGSLNQTNSVLDTLPLGNLGERTAVQDYYFIDGATGLSATVTLKGLNPTYFYSLGLFGTRAEAGARTTNYLVTDINGAHTQNLQTTGTGIGSPIGGNPYNGNNNNVINLNSLVPNANGELTLTVSIVNGGFAYLGAMQIVETVPEPSSSLLFGMAALGAISIRRRAAR